MTRLAGRCQDGLGVGVGSVTHGQLCEGTALGDRLADGVGTGGDGSSDGLGVGCGEPVEVGVEVAEVDARGFVDFFGAAEWVTAAPATVVLAGVDADGEGDGLGMGEPASGLMKRLSVPCAAGVAGESWSLLR